MTRPRHKHRSVAQQAAELAMAAPQVVAHRMSRMAMAGVNPSAADQREFMQMGSEKVLAFSQGAVAMWSAAARVNWNLAQAMAGSASRPGAASWLGLADHLWQWPQRTQQALGAGLAPVHAKAVSNAKRLSKRGKR